MQPSTGGFRITEAERAARAQRAVVAREAHQRKSAVRALDDPVKVDRAIRIVAEGISRGVIAPAAIAPDVEPSEVTA